MHKNIKAFTFDGYIRDDSDFARLRTQFENMIVKDMREKGYIPVLDFGPFFSPHWLGDRYSFMLTLYGAYVGKVKAWEYEGWDNGKLIPKNTVKRK